MSKTGVSSLLVHTVKNSLAPDQQSKSPLNSQPYSRMVINAHTKARFWTSSHRLPTIYSCGHDNSATDHSCFGIFFAYYKYLKINYFNFSSLCEAILTFNKQKERCGCAKTQMKKVISVVKNRFTFTCS